MSITHTDTNIPILNINRFTSKSDFNQAVTQGLIGNNELSIVGGDSSIGDLDDVQISSQSNGQVLVYNGTTGEWTNRSMMMDDLSDVNTINAADGSILMYNSSNYWGAVDASAVLPNQSGQSGKYLITNGTSASWASMKHDFGFASDGSQSLSYSAFFDPGRDSRVITISDDIMVSFYIGNYSDNYLWIENTGSSDADVTIGGAYYWYGSSSMQQISEVILPTDPLTIPAGQVCEIGIIANSYGAFITWRSDLVHTSTNS